MIEDAKQEKAHLFYLVSRRDAIGIIIIDLTAGTQAEKLTIPSLTSR
jgi:hypothetical protein